MRNTSECFVRQAATLPVPIAHPVHLSARITHGIDTSQKWGSYWVRTSHPQKLRLRSSKLTVAICSVPLSHWSTYVRSFWLVHEKPSHVLSSKQSQRVEHNAVKGS